jgi:Phosphatidylinositol N-acetylglucosaminyltransferase subunit Y
MQRKGSTAPPGLLTSVLRKRGGANETLRAAMSASAPLPPVSPSPQPPGGAAFVRTEYGPTTPSASSPSAALSGAAAGFSGRRASVDAADASFGPTLSGDALYGYCLLAIVFVCFVFGMYALLVAEFMPDTEIWAIDVIKRERYYASLVPASLMVIIMFVIANWTSLKFFRHN